MFFFTVLTFFSGAMDQNFIDSAEKMCKYHFDKYVIILEYGKSGVNPHLNIVYDVDKPNWSKNSAKYFKQLYGEGYNFNSHTIRTKRCNNVANVVGGYLQKEDNFRVIVNIGFDLDELAVEAKENLKNIKPKNAHEVVTYMIEHYDFVGHGEDPVADIFNQIVTDLVLKQYNWFVPYMLKLKNVLYPIFRTRYLNSYVDFLGLKKSNVKTY